jgi:hypothetical protein
LTSSADAPFDTETTCSGARTTRCAASGGAAAGKAPSKPMKAKHHRQERKSEAA